jgi:hypothetical protein
LGLEIFKSCHRAIRPRDVRFLSLFIIILRLLNILDLLWGWRLVFERTSHLRVRRKDFWTGNILIVTFIIRGDRRRFFCGHDRLEQAL